MTTTTYRTAPGRTIDVGGVTYAYRELGPKGGVPVVFLNHLAATLDNWDPRVVDGFAAKHHVIAINYRGVGSSAGKTRTTVEDMARDAIAVIRALGHDRVDLQGFSLGGMVSQAVVQLDPQLVRKLILTGTGPAGGVGIDKVTRLSLLDTARGLLTFKDPKTYLFFTRTPNGKREAAAFLKRLKERKDDRDKAIAVPAFRAQLKAIHTWGTQKPADLSRVTIPVFIANGDEDRMVPTSNSHDMAKRFTNSELAIYPDAGHGGVFQYHDRFVAQALEFLAK
ncbi:alpha/beta fold hydrolase [Aeromicrobium ginsengisoli]|uniref:Alpha/beta hydrolase n=1 Tax=Aeromicrobium ginsengisoli TaxID=363867 RepID=A0A5M4FF29_9ACTN|nr:alpha/beta hydrolase [Aeromicrobium ginsengisoli]KAA1397819.1 alpha/beta hydrolase [Aeromicrobium ginsengisoli]